MKKLAFLIVVVVICGGCASVEFYEDADLSVKTGLKICPAKPFILVEYNATKDNSLKTSVIWLPDLSGPQYLRVKPGIGSSELKLAFSNGILTSYGITTESQIPETINSLASLIAKGSDAIEGFKFVPSQTTDSTAAFELYEIIIDKERTSLRKVTLTK